MGKGEVMLKQLWTLNSRNQEIGMTVESADVRVF